MTSIKKSAQYLMWVTIALSVSACSVFKLGRQSPDEAYKSAQNNPPLTLPEGLRLPPPQ